MCGINIILSDIPELLVLCEARAMIQNCQTERMHQSNSKHNHLNCLPVARWYTTNMRLALSFVCCQSNKQRIAKCHFRLEYIYTSTFLFCSVWFQLPFWKYFRLGPCLHNSILGKKQDFSCVLPVHPMMVVIHETQQYENGFQNVKILKRPRLCLHVNRRDATF